MDRLKLAEDVTLFEEVGQNVNDPGFVAMVQRQVRPIPVADHASRWNWVRWTSTHDRLGVAKLADLALIQGRGS